MTELSHEPDAHRYTLRDNGAIVSVLEYADQGGADQGSAGQGRGVSFYHTVTVPNRRGEGHAERLVEFAVDDVERAGRGPIRASCWFVADWFDRHPERQELLAVRTA